MRKKSDYRAARRNAKLPLFFRRRRAINRARWLNLNLSAKSENTTA